MERGVGISIKELCPRSHLGRRQAEKQEGHPGNWEHWGVTGAGTVAGCGLGVAIISLVTSKRGTSDMEDE